MRDQTTYSINPEVLVFMRKSSGMSEEEIAKRLKFSKTEYLSIENGEDEISESDLIHLADISKRFGVSKLVTIIRMKELNIVNPYQYKSLKTKLEAVQRAGFGRRNWEQTYIKRTSRLVLNHLLDSFKRGDLTYTSLSTITGIKDKYLQKLIKYNLSEGQTFTMEQ